MPKRLIIERLTDERLAEICDYQLDHGRYDRTIDELVTEVERLRGERDQLAEQLGHQVDHEDGPCRFDHHGACQEHGGSELRPCDVATARELLVRVRDEQQRQVGEERA